MKKYVLILIILVLWVSPAFSAIYYVKKTSASPTPPYSTANTGAHDIQTVVNYMYGRGSGSDIINLSAEDTYDVAIDANDFFVVIGSDYDGLKIDGHGSTISNSGGSAYLVNAMASNVTVTNTILKIGASGGGIYNSSGGATVAGSTITTPYGEGIFFLETTGSTTVDRCAFTSMALSGPLINTSSGNIVISNNVLSTDTASSGNNISWSGTPTSYLYSRNTMTWSGATHMIFSLSTYTDSGTSTVFSDSLIATADTFTGTTLIDLYDNPSIEFRNIRFDLNKNASANSDWFQSESWTMDPPNGALRAYFYNTTIATYASTAAHAAIFSQSDGGRAWFDTQSLVTVADGYIGLSGCFAETNGLRMLVNGTGIGMDFGGYQTSSHGPYVVNNAVLTSGPTHTNHMIVAEAGDISSDPVTINASRINFRYTSGHYPVNITSGMTTTFTMNAGIVDALAGSDSNSIKIASGGTVNLINNTILRSHNEAISVSSGTVNITNNNMGPSTGAFYEIKRTGGAVTATNNYLSNPFAWYLSGTITDTNNIKTSTNTSFRNYAGYDYHLAVRSAAIDAGIDAGLTSDVNGSPVQRATPSMGAYEYIRPIFMGRIMAGK